MIGKLSKYSKEGLNNYKLAKKRSGTTRHLNYKKAYYDKPKYCAYCAELLSYNKRNNKFCNHSCAASYNNKGICRNGFKQEIKYCNCCGKLLIKKQKLFCNNKCQAEYNYFIYINKWKLGMVSGVKGSAGTSPYIRKYFFKKYNNKCQRCGWGEINTFTNKIPLELHHKDGNYKNNFEENLELLCPNCHSLTKTYKSRNKHCTRTHR